MNLEEIRTEIDALDKQLLALFERRMDLCRDVALYKKEHNLPVFQPEREEKLLDKIEQAASPDRKHAARTLFSVILDISKQLQSRILAKMEIDPIFPVPDFSAAQKIGCQGTNGANSETASQQFFPGRAVTFYPTFEHVFQAVERGEVEFGVLPVYNSTSGSVTPTYDLLGKYNCYITAMNQVKIKHCLAVRPGVSLEQIQAVYSHPQALMQCSDFLKYHNLKQIEYSNTATAAAFVASSSEPFAAICSEECAKQNHMDILFSGIANVALNYTRFICISKQMMVAPDASVISIMMTLPNVPGSLSKILNQFYLQGLDLVKLESRPIQDGSFDVAFYVDFKGNLMDRSIAAFLNADFARTVRTSNCWEMPSWYLINQQFQHFFLLTQHPPNSSAIEKEE